MASGLQDPPRPVAPSPGELAQTELGHEGLGGTRGHAELVRDGGSGNQGPGEHQLDETG